MTDEDRLILEFVILLTRINVPDAYREPVLSIVLNKLFNWDKMLSIVIKQKIFGLIYRNLLKLKISDHIPFQLFNALKYMYIGNSQRNKKILAEVPNILSLLESHGIDARPLKGALLIPLLYTDPGCRVLNDIDIFIKKSDKEKVIEVMENNGFCYGEYSRDFCSIRPYTNEDKILWKLKMFNLMPFCKLVESKYIQAIQIDFTFGLSYEIKSDISSQLMSESSHLAGYNTLNKLDFFIHLCCHLYKEASNEAWIKKGHGINLIKFCDVREYLLTVLSEMDIKALLNRIILLKVENPVYYTLYFLNLLYADQRTSELLNAMPEIDTQFMDKVYRQGSSVIDQKQGSVFAAIVS